MIFYGGCKVAIIYIFSHDLLLSLDVCQQISFVFCWTYHNRVTYFQAEVDDWGEAEVGVGGTLGPLFYASLADVVAANAAVVAIDSCQLLACTSAPQYDQWSYEYNGRPASFKLHRPHPVTNFHVWSGRFICATDVNDALVQSGCLAGLCRDGRDGRPACRSLGGPIWL